MVYRFGAQETEVRTFLSQDELDYEVLKIFLFSLYHGLWGLSSPTRGGTWTLRMRASTEELLIIFKRAKAIEIKAEELSRPKFATKL